MRLTCPNCGAQYEVQDALIPPAGRDVQCSACSTTWFQPGPRPPDPETETDEGPSPAPRDDTVPQPDAGGDTTGDPTEVREVSAPGASEVPDLRASGDTLAGGSPASSQDSAATVASGRGRLDEMETVTQVVEENDAALDDDGEDGPEDTRSGASVRGLDPSVRDILRSEAEREARLREAEASVVETQAEMPLDAAPDARDRRRLAAGGDEDAPETGAANAVSSTGSRRDLLPNIEEINSTLRARPPYGPDMAEDDPAPPSAEVVRRRGVRIGFFTTLATVAILVGLYVNAQPISERVPQAATALEDLVERIDAARFWLDDLARGLAGDDTAS